MRDYFDQLPYGAYLAGRDIVLFNRRYQPIVRISPPTFICHNTERVPTAIPVGHPVITPCLPTEWIQFESQVWFYTDANPPRRNRQTRERLEKMIADIPALAREIGHRTGAKVAA